MNLKSDLAKDKELQSVLRTAMGFILPNLLLFIGFGFALYLSTPGADSLQQALQNIFQLNSVQVWWYVTRSAGLTGYFLTWLSMVWGFAVSTKIFNPVVDPSYSYDFHEHLSLLGLGFVVVHVVVLLLDHYLPFNLIQILIPFTDTYRPLWVGIGIISLYVMLTVTVTFYLRKQLGMPFFRAVHTLSIFAYLGATLHGLFAGTDSALWVTRWLYLLTFLVVLFMTVYWLALNYITKQEKLEAERIAERKRIQQLRKQRV